MTEVAPGHVLVRAIGLVIVASVLLGGTAEAVAGNPLATTLDAPVPAILTEVESYAEDIVDLALAGDRAALVSDAQALQSAASGPAASALTRSGVPPAEVALLKERASRVARMSRRGSLIEVALGANGVSQLMPGLYGHFRSRVPSLIFRLDYLDREAQLRSLARQPGEVAIAVLGLRQTWPRVRARVVEAGGRTEASEYDRHVAAMKHLAKGDRRKVQEEAVRGLELVDDLERVFVR